MKERVSYFDKLRLLAILDVIALHIIGLFRNKYFLVDVPKYYLLSYIDQFTRVGVPIFFMLTGALMFDHKMEIKDYKEYFKTRVLKLVITYVVFATIFYLYEMYKGIYSFSIYDYATLLTSGTIEYHLWFMPFIISIYFLLPFLKKLVDHLDKKELEILILVLFIFGNCFQFIYMASSIFHHNLLENFMLPRLLVYTNYLFIGYYLKKEDVKITKKLIGISILCYICMAPLTYYLSKENGFLNDFFIEALSPLVIPISSFVFLIFKEKSKKRNNRVEKFFASQSSNIFYVYLIHVLFLKIIDNILGAPMKKEGLLVDFLYIGIYFLFTVISSFLFANIVIFLKKWIQKNKQVISNVLVTIFFFVFGCMITLFLVDFIGNFYETSQINYFDFSITLILSILFFGVSIKYQDRLFQYKILNYSLLGLYFILQLGIIYAFQVKPTWDFGQVYDIAVRYALGKGTPTIESYLYLCDNNIVFATALSIFFKGAHLLGIKNHFLELGLGLNLVCINISHFFTYKTIKEINPKYSKPFLIFLLFTIPLLFYLPVFYTDTITLPFVSVSLYFLYKYFFIKQKKHYIMITGLIIGIGGILKPTILILLVAIILYCIVRNNKKINYYLTIPILLISVSLPLLGNKWFVNTYFDENRLNKESLPKSHFILMGLKDLGSFNGEDYDRTVSIKGRAKRDTVCQKLIKERIKEHLQSKDILYFYNRKISYTWAYSSMYASDKLIREPIHKEYTNYINSENDDRIYWALSNTWWLILLVLMLFSIIFHKDVKKENQDFLLILTLSIFGLFLFLLVWETRSRYLVNFIPVFQMCGYIGLVSFLNQYTKKKAGE